MQLPYFALCPQIDSIITLMTVWRKIIRITISELHMHAYNGLLTILG